MSTAAFGGLVGDEDRERDEPAERRAGSSAARPSALSSRSAAASRGVTSGKSGEAVDGSK